MLYFYFSHCFSYVSMDQIIQFYWHHKFPHYFLRYKFLFYNLISFKSLYFHESLLIKENNSIESQTFIFQETAEIKQFQAYQKLCTFLKKMIKENLVRRRDPYSMHLYVVMQDQTERSAQKNKLCRMWLTVFWVVTSSGK